jgi:branched-subunit amino acid transport protein
MKSAAAAAPSDSYLTLEVALMGGLSILAFLVVWATVDKGGSLMAVSQLAFSLAFVVNHPHFLSSYVLLYGDFRKEIFTRRRYFWAAVVAPVILAGCLITALVTANQNLMAHVITSMFFFVGWHYVKQVFGCIVVTSAQRKKYYSLFERRVILVNLFATWFVSWLSNQVRYGEGTGDGANAFAFYGIPHYRLNLHPFFLYVTYGVMALTFAAILYIHVERYIRKGLKPSAPGVVAFAALYCWYIPSIIHPAFAYFIPLFHSLQYMAFVWALKRNQVAHEIRELSGEAWRRAWVNRFFGFFLLAVTLGALTFELIPKTLDAQNLISGMGPSPFLASFLLFINIHHYFIDNVIWRSDNPTIKQFLFQPAASNGAAAYVSPLKSA